MGCLLGSGAGSFDRRLHANCSRPVFCLCERSEENTVADAQRDHAGARILWLRLRRPRLAAGVAAGILAYALLLMFGDAPGRIRFILAWDVGVFLAMVLLAGLRNTSPETMKRIADRQDAGKWAVLLLTLLAATASLIAIAGEVPFVRNATDVEKLWRIVLIAGTIILSWTFIHTIFALHYAHDYYSTSATASG